jgi:hypothetical protein
MARSKARKAGVWVGDDERHGSLQPGSGVARGAYYTVEPHPATGDRGGPLVVYVAAFRVRPYVATCSEARMARRPNMQPARLATRVCRMGRAVSCSCGRAPATIGRANGGGTGGFGWPDVDNAGSRDPVAVPVLRSIKDIATHGS